LVDKLSIKEKFGFVPISVMDFDSVPRKWNKIDDYLNINMERRGKDTVVLPSLKFSKFSYGLSEFVLEYWSDIDDLILDPFSGWAIRGAVAITMGRRYIGYEISFEMRETAVEFIERITGQTRLEGAWGEWEIILGDGCLCQGIEDDSIDLIFTCPPYHDLEKYPDVEGQLSSIIEYEDFLDRIGYFFDSSYRVLKPDKYCAIVVADWRKNGFKSFHCDTIRIAKDSGFSLWDIIVLKLKSPFTWWRCGINYEYRYVSKSHEYLLIFKKEVGP